MKSVTTNAFSMSDGTSAPRPGLSGRARSAFTLIELMVVIGIIVILATLSVPTVRALTQNNSRAQAANQVRAMLSHARSLAVAQHRSVGVVFFEESAQYAGTGLHPNQTAMQLFAAEFDQGPYNPLPGTTVFTKVSNERDYLPAGVKDQASVEPIYETLDGWKKTTKGARSSKDLPAKAIKYIRRIEELIGCPAALVSTSPEREDVILMRDPFKA